MDNYIPRLAESKFMEISSQFPVAFLCGPRQCGKTTMLKHLCEGENRSYVSLADRGERLLAEEDPCLFIEIHKTPIIIDEIQYVPSLLEYIKTVVDKNHIPGEFWLISSVDYIYMKNVRESLAGRIGILNMYPLTLQEINHQTYQIPVDFSVTNLMSLSNDYHLSVEDVFEHIYRGGLPELYTNNNNPKDYYSNYVNMYLMPDVNGYWEIKNDNNFERFLIACSQNISEQVNYASLARASHVSIPTIKSWINVLQAMGIIYLVYPYYSSEFKRLTKAPKLYFYDLGLCSYLTRIPSSESLSLSVFSGKYFENYVMNQFKIKYPLFTYLYALYFYRDFDQKEIDIVLEDFTGLTPIEVKVSGSPSKNDTSAFHLLERFNKEIRPGGVICFSQDVMPLNKDNCAIPISLI